MAVCIKSSPVFPDSKFSSMLRSGSPCKNVAIKQTGLVDDLTRVQEEIVCLYEEISAASVAFEAATASAKVEKAAVPVGFNMK